MSSSHQNGIWHLLSPPILSPAGDARLFAPVHISSSAHCQCRVHGCQSVGCLAFVSSMVKVSLCWDSSQSTSSILMEHGMSYSWRALELGDKDKVLSLQISIVLEAPLGKANCTRSSLPWHATQAFSQGNPNVKSIVCANAFVSRHEQR